MNGLFRAVKLVLLIILLMFGFGNLLAADSPIIVQLPHVQAETTLSGYYIGNKTYVKSLLQPTLIGQGYIPIGANRTYVYTFQKGLKYHIYTIGGWVDNVDTLRTDYNILVFDSQLKLESTHTEAAGLPEHLGNTFNDPLYTPLETGNYSYMVFNDQRYSAGARNATLMAIEHLDTNSWYMDKLFLRGPRPLFSNASIPASWSNTTIPVAWSYEFNSTSPRIEVNVTVPDSLDMYEVRLYLMSNPAIGKGSSLSGMPVAWEPGLYGKTYNDPGKQIIGGYTLNTSGYRGNAFGSCSYAGQNMFINYSTPYKTPVLYQLVFIAEAGEGNLSFLIKTDFTKPTLKITSPSSTVDSGKDITVQAAVNASRVAIDYLMLEYRLGDNPTWASTSMAAQAAQAYAGTIPSQQEGAVVTYRVTAWDRAGNKASQQLSYKTLGLSSLTVSPSALLVDGGENATLFGQLDPTLQRTILTVNYTRPQGTKVARAVETNSTGGFRDIIKPDVAGVWVVTVGWRGNDCYRPTVKNASFTVRKLPTLATFNADKVEIALGESIKVNGITSPDLKNVTLKVVFTDPSNRRTTMQTLTGLDGSFSSIYTPTVSGQFTIQAVYDGDPLHEAFLGPPSSVKVNPKSSLSFLEQYLLYILIGGGLAAALIFFRLFRGKKKKTDRRVFGPQIRKLSK
ncbi:MAG: hypothetical protein V1850_03865 [Candidatus Bathyarchaeota archaeon]